MKPKLFLLCGLLCDQTVWQAQQRDLSAHYDVHIIDFYGFDSITRMAQHVLAQTSETFALAGHSMGARVALEVYRLAPERITHLALLDTGIHPVQENEPAKRMQLVEQTKQNGMPYLIKHWLLPMLATEHQQQPEIVEPLSQMVCNVPFETFTQQIHALLNRPEAQSVLASVRCPLLLGVGEQDAWSPVAQHQQMQQHAPHATLDIYPNAGHMAPIENPKAVSQSLLHWLNH